MPQRYVARITVLERHPDGTSRQYDATRVLSSTATVAELFDWRKMAVHDPLNGEYASPEIKLTLDLSEAD